MKTPFLGWPSMLGKQLRVWPNKLGWTLGRSVELWKYDVTVPGKRLVGVSFLRKGEVWKYRLVVVTDYGLTELERAVLECRAMGTVREC
jgi:hypothetical protein